MKHEWSRYSLNPCVHGRLPWLAPIGEFLAKFTPECPCCATIRWLCFSALTFGAGWFLSTW